MCKICLRSIPIEEKGAHAKSDEFGLPVEIFKEEYLKKDRTAKIKGMPVDFDRHSFYSKLLLSLCSSRSWGQLRSPRSVYADEFALPALVLELHDPFDQRKERVVLTTADVLARFPLRATLAGEDVAAKHVLAAEFLQPKPLGIRVASVPG
jgi:hypothetical protein